jgi:MYXO-CTERM domain-containing protein
MTTYKADVQAGLKSSSTFVAAACAAALGIAAKDDTAVTGTLIPLVKWNEPDTAQEDGQGLYAGHLLALVAWDRRQWAANGGDKGAITFYGDVATGTGGVTGTGGGGNRDASPVSDAKAGGDASANGGAVSSGGNGNAGASGAAGAGGVVASGGSVTTGGGDKGSGGGIGGKSANSSGNGGDSGSGSSTAGGASGKTSTSSGCSFALGGRTPSAPAALLLLAVVGLATRRRRS